MKNILLALCVPFLALPSVSNPTTSVGPFHCQVPCGIYGDTLRIDLLMEDLTTIEKAMGKLAEFQAEESPNMNQLVRWTMTKEAHAQKIQDQVAGYWLAQRIKLPTTAATTEDRAKYHSQLGLMHQITVGAMKCKQTTSTEHVTNLRWATLEFSKGYFKGEDLDHIKSHHGADHK